MRIGTMELVVILLVAFLVLGPEKSAQYSKKLGKALRTLKFYMNSFTEEFSEPIQEIKQPLAELKQPLDELKKPFEDLKKPLTASLAAPSPGEKKAEKKPDRPAENPAADAAPEGPEELEDAIPLEGA